MRQPDIITPRNSWSPSVANAVAFYPSFGARRMAKSAALLVDEELPYRPMRQWVLSVPYPLGFLFASVDVHGRGLNQT